MRFIYGPIDSWRLKRSLGVDLISQEGRICSFDCIYCQIQRSQKLTSKRKEFVDIEEVRNELEEALEKVGDKTDYITFSGMGEPTLALNLDEAVEMVKDVSDKPIAVLTNGSLFHLKEVREALKKVDYVIASLDASNEMNFKTINEPDDDTDLQRIIEGYKKFGDEYGGTFAIEVMFVQQNKDSAEDIAELVKDMAADEVQLNTPLRPSIVEPLDESKLKKFEKYFQPLETKNVYEAKRTDTPNMEDVDVISRGRAKK